MIIGLCGGKTGGHIKPLLKIKDSLVQYEYIYYGYNNSLEEKLTKNSNTIFIGFNYLSKFNLKTIKDISKNMKCDILISTGGYVSFPFLLVALFKKIPYYLIEENLIMCKVNKLFEFKAKKVFLTFKMDKMKKNYVHTFNPVVVNIKRDFKEEDFLLFMGGSLGSIEICNLAKKISILMPDKKIVLIAGKYYKDFVSSKMIVYEYYNNLIELMKKARICISRSGGATISELVYLHKKMILIPSLKVKNNHQLKNALYLEKHNVCKVVLYNSKVITNTINYINSLWDKKINHKDYDSLIIDNPIKIIESELNYEKY